MRWRNAGQCSGASPFPSRPRRKVNSSLALRRSGHPRNDEQSLRHGRGSSRHRQQAGQHRRHVEAAVEAVLEFRQVAIQVDPADPAGHALDVPLQVTQDRVHPAEGCHLGAPPATRGFLGVVVEPVPQETVGFPSVRQHQGPRHDGLPEPGLQFLGGDVLQGLHLQVEDALWFLGVRLDRHHEGRLPLGPAPSLPLVPFPAHVGVIHLHPPRKDGLRLALQHHLEELLLHVPGRLVVDPKLPLEFQRRDRVLPLSQQVHRQKPDRQGELGPLKNRPGGGACLVAALQALEQPARQDAVPGRTALRTDEAVRPPRLDQGIPALLLGAIGFEEGGEAQSLLELSRDPGARTRAAGNVIAGQG